MANSTGILFTRDQLIIRDDSPTLTYRRRKGEKKTAIEWARRKLLVSEIQFLTLFWNPKEVPHPKIVYIGAAPGIHIPFLLEYLPQLEYHLYDPRPFKINPTNQIKIYPQLFTDQDALQWKGRSDVFFISDIRRDYQIPLDSTNPLNPSESVNRIDTTTIVTTGEESRKLEKEILEDMEDQKRWVEIIEPVQAMLKFRLPYVDGTRSSSADRRFYPYFLGYILKQCWTGPTSAETRLVPISSTRNQQNQQNRKDYDKNPEDRQNKYTMKAYDTVKYQDQMFYHNAVNRETIKYQNPITKDDTPLDAPELLLDYDSVAEFTILREFQAKLISLYFTQSKWTSIDLDRETLKLSRLITQRLQVSSERSTESVELKYHGQQRLISDKAPRDRDRSRKTLASLRQAQLERTPTAVNNSIIQIEGQGEKLVVTQLSDLEAPTTFPKYSQEDAAPIDLDGLANIEPPSILNGDKSMGTLSVETNEALSDVNVSMPMTMIKKAEIDRDRDQKPTIGINSVDVTAPIVMTMTKEVEIDRDNSYRSEIINGVGKRTEEQIQSLPESVETRGIYQMSLSALCRRKCHNLYFY